MQQKLTQHCNAIIHYFFLKGSLVAQVVKSLPAMQENWVQSPEDLLEKEMAALSSILAWRIPWTEGPGRIQSMVLQSPTWPCNWHFHFQRSLYCCSDITTWQLLSCVWLFATPWIAACQASLSLAISQSLLKLMSIKTVMPSNHLILCHPLLLLPSIFPSIRIFSNE